MRLVDSIEEMADEDLMVRYRAGQTEAFDVIVRRHRGPLMAFIRRMVRDAARAEELLGDVFLKVHRAAPRYEPTAKLTTYLYTVAYRACLNALDREKHRVDHPATGDFEAVKPTGPRHDPERNVATGEALAALERELGSLADGHRAAFLLYYRQGLSCAEVAACLEITPAEAKGRLAYARKLLRQRLAPMLEE
ncbi:MAG: sigma-70 family RNA polymerase sigma factor [Proteobacteria bacterium]|nr:sigma-70 family RNA polymerase sigma factor [Pseudomonadota bacterium]